MKNILVCLDGSPRAPVVLAAAIDLAVARHAQLTLFRSVGLPPDARHAETNGEELIAYLVKTATDELAKAAATVPPTILGAAEVKVGSPWDAICAEARSLRADVIVIGSHGYRGLDRILGTTAAKVVNHATCSVLVVR